MHPTRVMGRNVEVGRGRLRTLAIRKAASNSFGWWSFNFLPLFPVRSVGIVPRFQCINDILAHSVPSVVDHVPVTTIVDMVAGTGFCQYLCDVPVAFKLRQSKSGIAVAILFMVQLGTTLNQKLPLLTIHGRERSQPYEVVDRDLDELTQQGLPFAILSNKPHEQTVDVVAHLFSGWSFRIVRGWKPGCPVKPDPSAASQIVRELDVPSRQCAFVGVDVKSDTRNCPRQMGHLHLVLKEGVGVPVIPNVRLRICTIQFRGDVFECHLIHPQPKPQREYAKNSCGGKQETD